MAHPDSPWKGHRNAKDESAFTRWVSTNLGKENRRQRDEWDKRGMDVVAGVRRKNLAPRPGKEMGGGTSPSRKPLTRAEKRAADQILKEGKGDSSWKRR